jgi:hypothetical protein
LFFTLVTAGRVRAEESAIGAGLGLSVAADGKNKGYGVGVVVAGERALIRRGALSGQAYAGALRTATRSGSCDAPPDLCELSARLVFAGMKARLHVHSRFVEAGMGVGRGRLVTRGGGSRPAVTRGEQLHLMFGFGIDLLDHFALSATYLYFPTANHLTGGVSLSYRIRRPPSPTTRTAER